MTAGVQFETRLALAARSLPNVRGRTNLAWWLKRQRERRAPLEGVFEIRLRGRTYMLPRGSSMAWAVAFTGRWDDALVAYASQFLESAAIGIDVGASLGLWTVPLAQAAQRRGAEIWAFEPHPANVRWLEGNLARNRLQHHTQVHPCALGSQAGSLELVAEEPAGGNAAVAVTPSKGAEVPVARLDDIPRSRPMSFIKLDVEGFELEVLRGARQILESDRPTILGEFDRTWLHRRGEDLPGALKDLSGLGYRIFALEQRRSRFWRAPDRVLLRAIRSPYVDPPNDLVLIHRDRQAAGLLAAGQQPGAGTGHSLSRL